MPNTWILNDAMRIELINPEFAAEVGRRENILLRHFSIFDDWVGPRPDLIKIGNLLNRSYFSDEQIRQALSKSLELASPAGYLAVIDNRERERSTIAGCQEGRWRVIKELNGGTDVRDLLAEFRFALDQTLSHVELEGLIADLYSIANY